MPHSKGVVMRVALICMLILGALIAHGDGFAYGKRNLPLRETGQVAVLRLEPGGVTVDMFIAIDGIPRGETVTYVLPFWHKPEGFRLEEMEANTFRKAFMQPAFTEVGLNNRLAYGEAEHQAVGAASLFSVGLFGPVAATVLFPVFAKAREKGRAAGLAPYETNNTPNARAELYQVGERDLPALLAKADLPAEQAHSLAKYRTPFFAVMRLTGAGDGLADRQHPVASRGVHYYFRHPMTGESTYRYIYPLGTGAAWPKPILLTEVYATCPVDYQLAVVEPKIGQPVEYAWILQHLVRLVRANDDELLQETLTEYRRGDRPELPPGDGIPALRMSLLNHGVIAPTAWHAAYFYSNPREDLPITLIPRAHSWQYKVAQAMADGWLAYCLAGINFLLAWLATVPLVLRPHWRKTDRQTSFPRYVLRMAWQATLFWWMLGLLAVMVMFTVFQVENLLLWLLFFVGTVLLLFYLYRRPQPHEAAAATVRVYAWLVAAGCYILLSWGLYELALWLGSAIVA